MRITRNYINAMMAANKNPASRKRMSSLSSTKKNNFYNTLTNKANGTSSIAAYQNMKNSAGELQATSSKLRDTGEDSIYAKAEESGSTSEITKMVKDFVNQYNSTVRNLRSAGGRVDTSYYNQLTSYAMMHRNALQETGVTKNADGTLSVNEKALQEASVEKLKQVWGSSSSFASKAGQTAAYVQSNAVSSMNSMINNSYSSLLRNFGISGSFFNFWS